MKKLILFFLIAACSISKKTDKSIIKECLDDYKQKSLHYIKDFSIYKSYLLLEKSLIDRGLLKKNDKESYIKLLEKIKLNDDKMLLLKKQLSDEIEHFDLLAHPTTFNGPFNCVKYYLINGDLDKNKTSAYLKHFDKLLIEDTKSNINAINNTPNYLFNEFDFRLPILATIYLKLYNIDGSGKVKL